jgi:hypothetical protein
MACSQMKSRSVEGLFQHPRDVTPTVALPLKMTDHPAAPEAVTPFLGEIEEAKRTPGGWVYRIAGKFGPKDRVPPEAIVGAWKVDAEGNISGDFIRNKNYDPKGWPAPK